MRRRFVSQHSRPATRFRHSPLTGHGLDPRIEACIAQGLILIQRQPDVADGCVVQMRPEQAPVGSLPFLVIPLKRQVRIGLPQRVMAITGPAVVGNVLSALQ